MEKRMIVIAVVALKGGVGKTTTATNLAWLLEKEHGKKVLVVDADCQGNSSYVFGKYVSGQIGMASLMSVHLDKISNYDVHDYIRHTDCGVDIIPADGYLMHTNGRLMTDTENNQTDVLSNALDQVKGEYDFCIIDCGLQMDMTVVNAILAADIVINPIRIGGFELASLEELANQIEDMRALKDSIRLISLITMFSNNKANRDIEDWLLHQPRFEFFMTHIRNSAVVTKYSLSDGPVVSKSKHSNPAKDYRAVLHELIERLGVE